MDDQLDATITIYWSLNQLNMLSWFRDQ